MNKNIVTFKIYQNQDGYNNQIFDEYVFDLNEKIIDIKNKILEKTYKNNFNYLDFENITERVYKDYGKLFFDLGRLPTTIDNYKLCEFTNENRIFSFIGIPSNKERIKNKPEIKQNNYLKTNSKYADKFIKKDQNSFQYNINDFPPL